MHFRQRRHSLQQQQQQPQKDEMKLLTDMGNWK